MKKATSMFLAIAMATAVSAPAFATLHSDTSATPAGQSDQVAKKGGGKKAPKSKAPKKA